MRHVKLIITIRVVVTLVVLFSVCMVVFASGSKVTGVFYEEPFLTVDASNDELLVIASKKNVSVESASQPDVKIARKKANLSTSAAVPVRPVFIDTSDQAINEEDLFKTNFSVNKTELEKSGGPKNNSDDLVRSINAGIEGGELTSYPLNVSGLDLSEALQGYNLKIIIRETSLELDSKGSDENTANKFKSALPSFYEMNSYQQFQDYVPENAGKNYTITGMNLGMNMGGWNMTFVNQTQTPDRKNKTFYGLNTQGPYELSVSNILRGSEKIYIEGRLLARDTDYDINYTKGEITFTAAVSSAEQIVVEYEIPPSGSDPGIFTGFRFEKETAEQKEKREKSIPKPTQEQLDGLGIPIPVKFSVTADTNGKKAGKQRKVESIGFSLLRSKVIAYDTGGTGYSASAFDDTNMGMDMKLNLGKNAVGLEFARSRGDKRAKIGHYATARFTIADSTASDHNTRGPYVLDSTKLPVAEQSETVRLNGNVLERDKDYTIDLEAGRITFINNNLNLTSLDQIEVEYRYVTEEDLKNYGETDTTGSAWLLSLDSNYGKMRHTLKIKNYGKDFMLAGNQQSDTLSDFAQQIEYSPIKSISLKFGRTGSNTLQDRENNLKNETTGNEWSIDWKRKAVSLSFKNTDGRERNNQESDAMNRTTSKQILNLDYAISKKIKFGLKRNTDDTDEVRSGSLLGNHDSQITYSLNLKPTKAVKLDLSQNQGAKTKRNNDQTSFNTEKLRTLKLKYTPSSVFMLSLDYDGAEFHNSDDSNSGNRKTRTWFTYQPSQKWSLFVQKQNKYEDRAGLWEKSGLDIMQVGWNPFKSVETQISFTVIASDKPSTQLDVAQTSFAAVYAPASDTLKITLKKDESSTDVNSRTETVAVASCSKTHGVTYGITFAPFRKEMPFSIETRIEKTSDRENPSQDYRKRAYKYGAEISFVSKSSIALGFETNKKTGAQHNRENIITATLKGNVSERMPLSFSYQIRNYTDNILSSASVSDRNMLISGNSKW